MARAHLIHRIGFAAAMLLQSLPASLQYLCNETLVTEVAAQASTADRVSLIKLRVSSLLHSSS